MLGQLETLNKELVNIVLPDPGRPTTNIILFMYFNIYKKRCDPKLRPHLSFYYKID